MEMNNKVTRHKYGHRGLNEFNSVNESVAKREFINNRLKKEQEAILEAQTVRDAELNRQSTLLENINNRKINEIKMGKTKNALYEAMMDKLVKVAFTEAFKESLYLDENYKIDNSEKLSSVVESFIDKNGGHKLLESAVKQNKDSLFLKSLYEACKTRAEKITREKCKESDNQPEKINFDIRLDELDEFKEDLSKTNIDTLGEIVKDKVLNTVIEEKERSIKKQEFEEDVKNEVEGAVSESLKFKIHNKNVIEQPSLFSAMMRKNYSDMLEESVTDMQSYNPNDKLNEIGLDDSEVDYNDESQNSLSELTKDENESGNTSFDNSSLATLDEESDDIDMFTLTNESVTTDELNDENHIHTSEIEQKPVNIWAKFVNTEIEKTEKSYEEETECCKESCGDEISELIESFSTDCEILTEGENNLVEKVKTILKKIVGFFKNIRDKILSLFKKKTEDVTEKVEKRINEVNKEVGKNNINEDKEVYYKVNIDINKTLDMISDKLNELKNASKEDEISKGILSIVCAPMDSDKIKEELDNIKKIQVSEKLQNITPINGQIRLSANEYKQVLLSMDSLLHSIKGNIDTEKNKYDSHVKRYDEAIQHMRSEKISAEQVTLCSEKYSKLLTEINIKVSNLNVILKTTETLANTLVGISAVSEGFTSVLDDAEEFVYESVLDEYDSVLESEDENEDMFVMESAVDSMELDEDGIVYEELMVSDDFIRNSVEKMSDKDLQNHLPKLEKMVKDLSEELKIAKSGKIPALNNSAVGPVRKFFVKLNIKLTGLTPEKAATNIQELITIGKKEITFVRAELKKRGLKAVSESFTSVLDEYDYLAENFSTVEEAEIDKNSNEYIAIESIAKLGNDNNLRVDQRRRVVALCESLSVGELAELTSKYRNEAVYLNENITKLSNMNEMDKAVYVYESSLSKEGYNFNEELAELKKSIEYCNEQVGLFNIAAKILISLESLGLTEACKNGAVQTVCHECGANLTQGSNCKDCGTSLLDRTPYSSVTESVMIDNEENSKPSAEVFMDKVLCESLIQYTLLEMMNTAKVVNYTTNDVKKMALEMNK